MKIRDTGISGLSLLCQGRVHSRIVRSMAIDTVHYRPATLLPAIRWNILGDADDKTIHVGNLIQ